MAGEGWKENIRNWMRREKDEGGEVEERELGIWREPNTQN